MMGSIHIQFRALTFLSLFDKVLTFALSGLLPLKTHSGYVNWGRVASYGVELGVNWVKQMNKDLFLTWVLI